MLPVSKLSRTWGWYTSAIRSSMARAFWVEPLCISIATVIACSPDVSPIADPAQVLNDGSAPVGVGRRIDPRNARSISRMGNLEIRIDFLLFAFVIPHSASNPPPSTFRDTLLLSLRHGL